MDIDFNDPKVQEAIAEQAKKISSESLKDAIDKEVAGLKAKNQELLDKLSGSKAQHDAEAKELEAFRKQKAEQEQAKAIQAGEFDKVKEQIVEQYEAKIAEFGQREKKLERTLEEYLIDGASAIAIAESKGNTKLLMPHVKANLKVVEENGGYHARVVNSDGSVRIGENKGAPMTIGELLTTMKSDPAYQAAFEGSGANGSGATRTANGSRPEKTMTRSQFDAMDAGAKSEFAKSGGQVTADA